MLLKPFLKVCYYKIGWKGGDEARFQIADSVFSIQKLVAGAVDKVEGTDSAAWTYEALATTISNSLILNDCSQAINWK